MEGVVGDGKCPTGQEGGWTNKVGSDCFDFLSRRLTIANCSEVLVIAREWKSRSKKIGVGKYPQGYNDPPRCRGTEPGGGSTDRRWDDRIIQSTVTKEKDVVAVQQENSHALNNCSIQSDNNVPCVS